MRLGHLSRLLLGPFSAPFFLDVGETGGGAPLNILALDSEVGIPVLGGGISNRWEKGRIRFRGIFLMDPFEIHIYIFERQEFVKFFTAAVRYGSTSRVDLSLPAERFSLFTRVFVRSPFSHRASTRRALWGVPRMKCGEWPRRAQLYIRPI